MGRSAAPAATDSAPHQQPLVPVILLFWCPFQAPSPCAYPLASLGGLFGEVTKNLIPERETGGPGYYAYLRPVFKAV